jgi:formate-dependent nitrite reductase membrane component NrfD
LTHMQTESGSRNAYTDETTQGSGSLVARPRARRVSTETKAAFKTTEFFVYVLSVIAVLVASTLVGDDSNANAVGGATGDYFRADRAWLLITILTVGYMVSRGIAKSGSKDYYDDAH